MILIAHGEFGGRDHEILCDACARDCEPDPDDTVVHISDDDFYCERCGCRDDGRPEE